MGKKAMAEQLYDSGQWDRALEKAVEEFDRNIIRLASRQVLMLRNHYGAKIVELAATYNEDSDLGEWRKDIILKMRGTRPAEAPSKPQKPPGERIAEMVE